MKDLDPQAAEALSGLNAAQTDDEQEPAPPLQSLHNCWTVVQRAGKEIDVHNYRETENFIILASVWALLLSHYEGAAPLIVNIPHPGLYLDDVSVWTGCNSGTAVHGIPERSHMGESLQRTGCVIVCGMPGEYLSLEKNGCAMNS